MIQKVYDGEWRRVALVARTAADARDVMVEGESGILAYSPPWFRPRYQPSKRRLIWPNGARATTYSADVPDLLRGPQHDGAWGDELASWRFTDAYDQLSFGLRLGDRPQSVFTTTPRPTKLIKELIAEDGGRVRVTRGSTFANAKNLAPAFINSVLRRYQGTRLGQQELYAKVLDDNPNALWQRKWIDASRTLDVPSLRRVAVGVDPGIATEEGAAETGIVAAGVAYQGTGKDRCLHGYILDDKSILGTPNEWAREVIACYKKHRADLVIGEINQGGQMVEYTVKSVDRSVKFKAVRATRGKAKRAEPVSSLYEQGRVHHVGTFAEVEDQMCEWDPLTEEDGNSPDRMDALVWVLTELIVTQEERRAFAA